MQPPVEHFIAIKEVVFSNWHHLCVKCATQAGNVLSVFRNTYYGQCSRTSLMYCDGEHVSTTGEHWHYMFSLSLINCICIKKFTEIDRYDATFDWASGWIDRQFTPFPLQSEILTFYSMYYSWPSLQEDLGGAKSTVIVHIPVWNSELNKTENKYCRHTWIGEELSTVFLCYCVLASSRYNVIAYCVLCRPGVDAY